MELAKNVDYHPRAVRENLRLAFLPAELTAIIVAEKPCPSRWQ